MNLYDEVSKLGHGQVLYHASLVWIDICHCFLDSSHSLHWRCLTFCWKSNDFDTVGCLYTLPLHVSGTAMIGYDTVINGMVTNKHSWIQNDTQGTWNVFVLVISFHTSLGMWLLIHPGIKVKQVSKRGYRTLIIESETRSLWMKTVFENVIYGPIVSWSKIMYSRGDLFMCPLVNFDVHSLVQTKTQN